MNSEVEAGTGLLQATDVAGGMGLPAVLDRIAEHIVIHDRNMTVIWANRAAGDSVGLEPNQLTGKHCFEIWQGRRQPCEGCPVKRAFDTGVSHQAEMESPDGRSWFVRSYPVRDAANRVSHVVEITSDITDRKRAEVELRESQQKYSNLFQYSCDAILVHDMEGRIVDVNERSLQMFGYSRSEILSLRIPDLHPREALNKSRWAFEEISRKGFVSFEIEFKNKSGQTFPAEVSSSLLEVQGRKVIQGVVRDITDRRTAERALRRSEEQHRSLVQNINEIIFTLDTQGRFTYLSPVVERTLGYAPDEIISRPFNCFVHPDDAPGLLVTLEQSLRGGHNTHEVRVLDKDGSAHFVLISCRPNMEDDQLTGVTGIMADVTESRMAHAVLRESEEMYETLVRTTTDAVTVSDLQGCITEVSGRALQLHGADKAEDLIGRSSFELLAPEDHRRALQNLKKTLKEGSVRGVEYTFLRKDGTQFIGELDAAVFKDAGGRPKGFISTVKDVTERKRAEQALRRSEQRFRDIAENASEWIWEVDVQGTYTYSSPVIKKILGCEPEEVLGKHFYDLYPPEEIEQMKEAVFDVFARKKPFREYVHRNVRKDGSSVWLSTSGVPIFDDNGELLGYRGADTDITEGRLAREQLAAEKEHLKRTLRAIDDAVVATDVDSTVVIYNIAAENLTGRQEDEAVGRPLNEVLNLTEIEPDTLSEDIFGSAMHNPGDSAISGTACLVGLDGRRTRIGFTADKILNKDRQVSGVVVIFNCLPDQ
jgi:PAS domain S-box-containing protein